MGPNQGGFDDLSDAVLHPRYRFISLKIAIWTPKSDVNEKFIGF